MKTPETTASFARDLQACKEMQGRNREFIRKARALVLDAMAAYERVFDGVLEDTEALPPPGRLVAADLLAKLGNDGCLSGTYAFWAIQERLKKMGVPRSTALFGHDRQYIAEMVTVHKFIPERPATQSEAA